MPSSSARCVLILHLEDEASGHICNTKLLYSSHHGAEVSAVYFLSLPIRFGEAFWLHGESQVQPVFLVKTYSVS